MREILFRGRKSNKNWVVGFYYGQDPIYNDDSFIGYVKDESHKVETKTVGQYSGIKDKNKKKIFEGDLFRLGAEKQIFEVRFEHGCFMAYNEGKQFGLVGELQICFIDVIGNIFDNADLLQ